MTTTHSTASVLNDLIETCKDGEEGFRAAAEDVKDETLKAVFQEYSQQREAFIAELQSLVRGLGEKMETRGSVAGAMHRGWMDLKAALGKDDPYAILAECERGEDVAIEEFREALKHEELPGHVRQAVERQREAVQLAHDRIRNLRDSFQS